MRLKLLSINNDIKKATKYIKKEAKKVATISVKNDASVKKAEADLKEQQEKTAASMAKDLQKHEASDKPKASVKKAMKEVKTKTKAVKKAAKKAAAAAKADIKKPASKKLAQVASSSHESVDELLDEM